VFLLDILSHRMSVMEILCQLPRQASYRVSGLQRQGRVGRVSRTDVIAIQQQLPIVISPKKKPNRDVSKLSI